MDKYERKGKKMVRLYSVLLLLLGIGASLGFSPLQNHVSSTPLLHMAPYSIDGSEYSSSDSDFVDDDDVAAGRVSNYRDTEEDDTPTVELQPVPMSKNSGNRFVALLWDRLLDSEGRDALDLHDDRIALTEDHVMFCRKANLYNEEFNTDSMVDVLWSRQV